MIEDIRHVADTDMTGYVDMTTLCGEYWLLPVVHELCFKRGILNLQFYILSSSEIGNREHLICQTSKLC